MDLLKNNWGFWLITLVCVIGIVTLVALCAGSAGKLDFEMAEVNKKMEELEKNSKKGLAFTKENIEIAESNAKAAEKGINMMRQELSKRFELRYTVPETSIEALRALKEELNKMRNYLDENGVSYSSSCDYFTFDSIAKATQPPNRDDLDAIFRHLAVVKIVLDNCVKAKIAYLESLSRPMGLLEQDEGSYKFIPIELTIVTSPTTAQNFINIMAHTDANLFFFRNFSLVASDSTTEVGKDIHDTAVSGNSSVPSQGSSMGNEMMDGGGASPRRGRRGANRNGEGEPAGGEMGNAENGNGSKLVDLPLRRQELLIYEPKTTKWTLRFDMVIFNREEEKPEEGSEEGNDAENNGENAD